jgi:hypothetical protein
LILSEAICYRDAPMVERVEGQQEKAGVAKKGIDKGWLIG